ncbi:hypothetical protein HYH03_012535 [Edaphochlamys debaryana]|uniref:Uncharacterized protein n=1 Tax=Edaphochlamys debaryana TaxID=47281 RepID=A0A836BU05_9CHLO|nr:hypothetical protein HYH03_012535 [Edaphochlamys debaryana]|eukprot:KAG2488905.1 hypothetical protein HYH03_012535 [Edaphochlamys debaryana]
MGRMRSSCFTTLAATALWLMLQSKDVARALQQRELWNPQPFWTQAQLDTGAAVHTPAQFVELIRKLEAGQPINVVAWGSSVTAEFAGCYSETGRTFMRPAGVPRSCDLVDQPTAVSDEQRFATGWGTLLMRLVNDTWPHANHSFANNGRAGSPLDFYAAASCGESMLPDPLDLLILENMGGASSPAMIELTMRMAIHSAHVAHPGGPRPAIILLNSNYVVETDNSRGVWALCMGHYTCNTSCAPDGPHPFQHIVGQLMPGSTEPQSLELGALYGIDVLPYNTWLHMLMRDGSLPSQGVGACEELGKLFSDSVHPRMLGRHMLGELLFASLTRARAWLAANGAAAPASAAPAASSSPASDTSPASGVSGASALAGSALGAVEAGASGSGVYTGSTGGGGGGLLWGSGGGGWGVGGGGWGVRVPGLPVRTYATGALLLEEKRCYMAGTVGPGFTHKMDAAQVPKSYLDVVSSQGWVLVFFDGDQAHRHKPGLVAWEPGSTLQVRGVPGEHQPMTSPGPDGWVAVAITFLISYTERGMAEVTCVSGCTCDPLVIDSHTEHHYSVSDNRFFAVTQSPDCLLQLRVLTNTTSGGHRFKLLGVTVKAPLLDQSMG